ncbi:MULTISPECIES: hypothetical protein [unclassified Bradyrhizobium]|uniref:hypothetical protein n=1 Tax=unclassified Bradyrhizobium TaxID=2631580 RepID=UPI001BA5D6AC|nr:MULTISPECIES: hypothetical protein [unclassified Bradyrhizobium]WLA52398.1 hypothetical protein QIH80_21260 [Bradyrhizobium elkanii]MBR1206938.1 hypothetical protein [Bradyrhizobium sp. AUGA SZCCT0124]MBR1313477.1 hypothetical protein [Bradyrhizobium sp. AUGA SZCCT0051]MBR1343426.1 hypothetical protein [Bradyrhizobium sp. AUGA SZCCT0105]MBR1357154.1 hypothetical protein [Bradyrhizobium sp. AUGA SZCCT0045]
MTELLLLRRTVIGGETAEGDYVVIWDEIRIGRIHQQTGLPAGRSSVAWGVAFPGRPQLPSHRGLAKDQAEAKQMVKLIWSAIRPTLTDDEIREARERQEYNDHGRPWNRPKHWRD